MMRPRFRLPETGVTDPVGRLPAMLFTASTLKDSPANVRFFVAANLASGVDHMFVFLDAPARARAAGGRRTPGRPSAGHLHPDRPRAWWADERPPASTCGSGSTPTGRARCSSRSPGPSGSSTSTATRSPARPRRRWPRSRPSIDAVWLRPVGGRQRVDPARTRPTRFKRLLEDARAQPAARPRGDPRRRRTRRTSTATSWASRGSGPASGLAPDPARGRLRRRRAATAPRGPRAAGAALRRALG